jgi:hypothetical protein
MRFTGTYPFWCIKGVNDVRTPEKEAMRAALRMPQSQWFPLGNMSMFLKENTDPFPPPVAPVSQEKKMFPGRLMLIAFFVRYF